MKVLRFEHSEVLSHDSLLDEIIKFLEANGVTEAGRIRITVFRDSGGFYTPNTNTASFLIDGWATDHNEFVLNEKGWKIDVFEDNKKSINTFANLKTTNSLVFVLAGLYAKDKKLDECVILNEHGLIVESIRSNIFVVLNRVIYTPSIDQGIIPGVMRSQVLSLATENKIEVQECALNPAELMRADEVILTNSVTGIQWVGAYKRKRYFNAVAKLLVDKLNKRVANLEVGLLEN